MSLRDVRADRRAREVRARAAGTSSRRTRSPGSRARSSTSSARWTGCPRSVRFKAREIEKALRRPRVDAKRAADREGAGRAPRDLAARAPRRHHQISFVSVLALDEMVSVGSDRGEQVSLIDTLADKGIDPTPGRRGAGDARAPRGGDQLAVRTREDRRHAVLLRGADPRRDRRDPRRDRVARLPDPHEGRRRPPRPAHRGRLTRRAVRRVSEPRRDGDAVTVLPVVPAYGSADATDRAPAALW